MDIEWESYLQQQIKQHPDLQARIKKDRLTKQIFPENHLVFNAFKQCPYWDLKVVMMGTEPYGDEYDMGLAYSTLNTVTPVKQKIIKDEIIADIYKGYNDKPFSGFPANNLYLWAQQGVLLLNERLTAENVVKSAHKGWEAFTIETIKHINKHRNNVVFLLWGSNQKYASLIDNRHLVLTAESPAGSKHFSQANKFILTQNKNPIGWHLLPSNV